MNAMAAEAAQQAVAADGRASLLLERSGLSPVVDYHGLGRCHLRRLAFLDAAAAEQRYVGRAMKLIDLAHAVATESASEFSPDSFLEDLVVVRGRDYWGDAAPGWVWNGDTRAEALTADLQLQDRFILFEEVGHYPVSCIFFLESMADLENRILSESGFFNSFTTQTLAFVDGALKRFECFSVDDQGMEILFKKDEQVDFGLPAVRKLRWC